MNLRSNVLLTCAGRRNYLVDFFKKALSGRGKVVCTDCSKTAPAMAEADIAVLVPRIYEPNYTEELLDICRRFDIALLVSLNDLDLPILSRNAKKFKEMGVALSVSDSSVIDICFDKLKTAKFLESIGLKAPKTYTSICEAKSALKSGELSLPAVLKPRWGSGSIGLEFPQSLEELELAFELLQKKLSRTILREASQADWDNAIVIQEQLKGQEYGLDIVNDFSGKNAAVFVKRKIRMRAGETDIAESVEIPELAELGKLIAAKLQHIGNLDCDIFYDGKEACVLEMNPRFGGGYPFTQCSGANIPKAYLAWANGERASEDCFNFQIGKTFSKCDRLVEIKA